MWCLDYETKELTLLRITSGARYSGVPQRVHVLPRTFLAKPKSVTYKNRKILDAVHCVTLIFLNKRHIDKRNRKTYRFF